MGFMAGLNVNMEVIASIAQEIISLYMLWENYKDDGTETTARRAFAGNQAHSIAGSKRSSSGDVRGRGALSEGTFCVHLDTPVGQSSLPNFYQTDGKPSIMTPTFMTKLLLRMRDNRMNDIAHPPSGRPMVYDKRLERTQAAG